MSEANAMKQYLVALGTDNNRIFLENQSTSTYENLKFSFKLIEKLDIPTMNIGIVSTDFHIYRATLIAKRLEYNGKGEALPNIKSISLKNNLREGLALIKDYLLVRK